MLDQPASPLQFVQSIELRKLILIWTPPFLEQYIRPYTMNVSETDLEQTIEKIMSTLGQSSTPAINDDQIQLIMPSSEPHAVAAIPGGWQEDRFIFFMDIEGKTQRGTEREILSGFTEYAGLIQHPTSVVIDPNMIFRINTVSRFISNTIIQPNTVDRSLQIQNTTLQLSNPTNTVVYDLSPPSVIGNIQTNQMADLISEANQRAGLISDATDVVSTTTSIVNASKSTRMKYSHPGAYVGDIVRNYTLSQISEDMAHDSTSELLTGEIDIYGRLQSRLHTSVVSDSIFVDALTKHIDYSHMTTGLSSFTYGQLERIFPYASNNTDVIMNKSKGVVESEINSSERWSGVDIETNIVYMITHMLPIIMTKFMLNKISFIATNKTIGNEDVLQIDAVEPLFSGVFDRSHVGILTQMLHHHLLIPLFKRSFIGNYELTVRGSLAHLFKIQISINDQPAVPFVAPAFCTGFYSPMLSPNVHDLQNLSLDIENLTREVNDTMSNTLGKPNPEVLPQVQPPATIPDITSPYMDDQDDDQFFSIQ